MTRATVRASGQSFDRSAIDTPASTIAIASTPSHPIADKLSCGADRKWLKPKPSQIEREQAKLKYAKAFAQNLEFIAIKR
jgi:hypothetical protein